MILAAGRGTRMRELTEKTAKPLLSLWGRPMLEWQLLKAKEAGFSGAVINTAHHSELFDRYAGSKVMPGLNIEISKEGEDFSGALETKGGIVKALPLLSDGKEPFAVVSGDIVTAYDYRQLRAAAEAVRCGRFDAHLVLVPNPYFKDTGDMDVREGLVYREPKRLTYGNIAVFSPRVFEKESAEKAPLFPWLYQFVDAGRVSGELYCGPWANVGTPEDLAHFGRERNFAVTEA